MKLFNKFSIAILFSSMFSIMPLSAAELTISVTDISKQQGSLFVVLFNSADAYNGKGKPLKQSKVTVAKQAHTLVFSDIDAGTYAVKLFHDENDNGKLDSNVMGIPSEGYGFSNNAGAFGPASFKDASFSVTDDSEISIKLR